MTIKTVEQLKSELAQFTGTENWYGHSLMKSICYTDGVKYLAEVGGNHGAYWLIDLIASHQMKPKVRRERFQVWKLKRNSKGGCQIKSEDGNGNVLSIQNVPYTDFQMDIELYCILDEEMTQKRVIMLTSEY